jgi:signal transduction histidine kinase
MTQEASGLRRSRLRPWRLAGRVILALAFLFILADAVYSLVMLRQLQVATEWAQHSQQVLIELDHLRGYAKDAEIARDPYLLSGDEAFLATYRKGVAAAERSLASIRTLTADNPSQQQRIADLAAVLHDYFGLLDSDVPRGGIKSGGAGAIAEAQLMAEKAALDKVRAGVEAMQDEEKRLYRERNDLALDRHAATQILLVLGTIASLILIAVVFRLLQGEARRSARLVLERTTELAVANRALRGMVGEREKQKAELQRLNETLEQRVAAESDARLKAEERLHESQRMEAIGRLTGGVAHDFNNLLTVIVGNIETLLRRLPKEEAQFRRLAEGAMEGARRAVVLTRHLLAFSRRQPLEPKPIDLNKLVSGMSTLLTSTLGERVSIETVLAGGIWWVSADASELETALINLAVNARDAMPGGGRLTIETANAHLDESYAHAHQDVTPGQYAMIAVSDSGVGMPKEVAAKAFEPFFTTKDIGQGTGLGLSQVYGFVKQSGGHVKIYSEPGEGTTLRIYLPRLIDKTETERKPPTAKTAAAGGNETVLVVEDDEGVRAYSAEILREVGYRVLETADGAAALRIIEAEPDLRLLFTDVGLPGGLNGRQLAEEARRRRPDLRVLYTTGYARNAIVHHGRLDPGVELIVKPFNHASLAAKVRHVLDGE